MTREAATWWSALLPSLDPATRWREHEPLAPKTTMRVGGPARYYAEPATVADLVCLKSAAEAAGVPVFILGRGSNLIVLDTGFEGLVIRLAGERWTAVRAEGGSLEAGAAARLKRICAVATAEGLSGFEFLEGIPGTLGGALRMNAGAMGGWIFDLVEAVTCLEPDGTVVTHPAAFFHPAYRSCPELDGRLALGARLRGGAGHAPPAIREKIDTYARVRRSSQPREPSAGCIFKNPENGYAGKLIDELGLKGRAVGGARVSGAHGNFIVNTGDATAADILALIREVRASAAERAGVTLEPEALLLGAKWEDVL